MSRSRKAEYTSIRKDFTPKVYQTALYLRLSSDELAGGEKLKNQQDLLMQFVNTQEDLIVADIYTDNGHTGTNFDRSEWQRLMDDAGSKRINCIIVKDLSRFGRNYIETGWYLENVFPHEDIRFIAVNDSYDSAKLEAGALQPLDAMIKGIVNEAYAKDISRKIFATKELQRKNGLYYGNIPPYGYQKDPVNPHHLIINKETSEVVAEIFQAKMRGLSNTEIAGQLNARNIPAPMRYQFLQGNVTAARFQNSVWQRITIKVILENRTYTGDLAMGKKQKNLSRNLTKVRRIPNDLWVITENTHDAIISRELYFTVQHICQKELEVNRATRRRHSDWISPEDIFTGLIYSKTTQMKMYRSRIYSAEHGMRYRYTTGSKQNIHCTKFPVVTIQEEQLRSILQIYLKKQAELVLELQTYLNRTQDQQRQLSRREEAGRQSRQATAELEALGSKQQQLYLHYSEGRLTLGEYRKQKESIRSRRILLAKQQTAGNAADTITDMIHSIEEFVKTGVLTKELLNTLVEKICVCDSKNIEIHFKYRDETEPLLKPFESGVLPV